MAGFNMSVSSCVDHALDGFTVWGSPLLYVIGRATYATRLTDVHATSQAGATTDYVLTNADMTADNVIPWGLDNANGDHGDPDYLVNTGATHVRGLNMGQVRAWVPFFGSAVVDKSQLCFVFTSSEYFAPSAWLCMHGDKDARLSVAGTIDVFLATTGNETLGAMFNKTYYGSIWNAWAYQEVFSTASTYLRGQDADHVMIVGSRQGTGVVGRMKTTNGYQDSTIVIDDGTPLS